MAMLGEFVLNIMAVLFSKKMMESTFNISKSEHERKQWKRYIVGC